MKDLKLRTGSVCYLGKVEFTFEGMDLQNSLYNLKCKHLHISINYDGSLPGAEGTPIFSVLPYEMPEMTYEKPPEIDEIAYFWDDEYEKRTGVEISYYKGLSGVEDKPYKSASDNWKYCSTENPLLKL